MGVFEEFLVLWDRCDDDDRKKILHYVADYAGVLWLVLGDESRKEDEVIESLYMQRMNYLVAAAPWVFFGKGKNTKRHIQMFSEPDLTICKIKILPNCFIDVQHTRIDSVLCGNCKHFSVISESSYEYIFGSSSVWSYVGKIVAGEFKGKTLDELISMCVLDGLK